MHWSHSKIIQTCSLPPTSALLEPSLHKKMLVMILYDNGFITSSGYVSVINYGIMLAKKEREGCKKKSFCIQSS